MLGKEVPVSRPSFAATIGGITDYLKAQPIFANTSSFVEMSPEQELVTKWQAIITSIGTMLGIRITLTASSTLQPNHNDYPLIWPNHEPFGSISVNSDHRRLPLIVNIQNAITSELAMIWQHHQQQQQLNRDTLTGLFNRRNMHTQVTIECNRAQRYNSPLSLIFIDIDNFKQYNDTYGHTAGDELLTKAGKLLLSNSRDSDSCFRYGGEEFVVLLPETTKQAAYAFAKKIKSLFKKQLSETVSIGIANHTNTLSTQQFIDRADKAMYRAKTSGKNRICTS